MAGRGLGPRCVLRCPTSTRRLSGGRASPIGPRWARPGRSSTRPPTAPDGWPSTHSARSATTAPTPTSSWRACSANGACRPATPRSPPSCWPAPAAARAPTTRSSPRRPARPQHPPAGGPGSSPARRAPAAGHAGAGPAAVAATVDLAAATVGERVTGLVNAVLRRVAADDLDGWLDRLGYGLDDPDRLGLLTAHPRWIVDAYADLLPAGELRAALDADNVAPQVSLAVRPGLAECRRAARGWGPRRAPVTVRGPWSGNPADLAPVREGRAGVQDEGSQLVTWALTRVPAPAGPWLDLCAGPGGKTALLAGLAGADDSALVAVELAPHRAMLVAQAVRAFDRGQAPTVLVADGTAPAWRPSRFARVLVDAPCSGLGALRRRPESRWRRSPADVEQLHPLQVSLLRHAVWTAPCPAEWSRYVTCSPHRRETSDVIDEILAAARTLAGSPPSTAARPRRGRTRPIPAAVAAPARHRCDVCGLPAPDIQLIATGLPCAVVAADQPQLRTINPTPSPEPEPQ